MATGILPRIFSALRGFFFFFFLFFILNTALAQDVNLNIGSQAYAIDPKLDSFSLVGLGGGIEMELGGIPIKNASLGLSLSYLGFLPTDAEAPRIQALYGMLSFGYLWEIWQLSRLGPYAAFGYGRGFVSLDGQALQSGSQVPFCAGLRYQFLFSPTLRLDSKLGLRLIAERTSLYVNPELSAGISLRLPTAKKEGKPSPIQSIQIMDSGESLPPVGEIVEAKEVSTQEEIQPSAEEKPQAIKIAETQDLPSLELTPQSELEQPAETIVALAMDPDQKTPPDEASKEAAPIQGKTATEEARQELAEVEDLRIIDTGATEGQRIIIYSSFEANDIILTPRFYEQIPPIMRYLQSISNLKSIEVLGYISDDGRMGGTALSLSRARLVQSVLKVSFLPRTLEINAKGMGKENPIADNKTAEGRLQNRRIELVLHVFPSEVKHE